MANVKVMIEAVANGADPRAVLGESKLRKDKTVQKLTQKYYNLFNGNASDAWEFEGQVISSAISEPAMKKLSKKAEDGNLSPKDQIEWLKFLIQQVEEGD